jgi:hypothetical protein
MALSLKHRALDWFHAAFPTTHKHRAELDFWQGLFSAEGGRLWNGHFEPLLTTVYDLEPNEFSDKRILDIGCGPPRAECRHRIPMGEWR